MAERRQEITFRHGTQDVVVQSVQGLIDHRIEMHPDAVGQVWGSEAAQEYTQTMAEIRRANSAPFGQTEVVDAAEGEIQRGINWRNFVNNMNA